MKSIVCGKKILLVVLLSDQCIYKNRHSALSIDSNDKQEGMGAVTKEVIKEDKEILGIQRMSLVNAVDKTIEMMSLEE